jgi:hypothetical protein
MPCMGLEVEDVKEVQCSAVQCWVETTQPTSI